MMAVFRLRSVAHMNTAIRLSAKCGVFVSEDGQNFMVQGNDKAVMRLLERLFQHNLLDEDHAPTLLAHDELKSETFALFILEMISTPTTRDAVIGDLIEARDKVKAQYGERKARIYFWWQVSRTIGHFAWAWVRRLRWIAVALGFVGWVARKLSS
jgi:hypothetical protein